MLNRWTMAVTALIATALLTGCHMNQKARTVRLDGAEMPAGAPLALDIENRSGSVTVRVDPKLTKPLVLARPASGDAATHDGQPWAAAELAQQDDRWVLRVIAGGAETPESTTPVILTVRVPSCEGIRVKNAGGPVSLREVGGAITVTNTDLGARTADVEVRTRRDLDSPVTLTTTGGDIYCLGGRGTAGLVTLVSQDREPELRSRYVKVTQSRNLPRGLSARVGDSDNPITITSDRGEAVLEVN